MEQLLKRGYKLPQNSKIKRQLVQGDGWRIYLTDNDEYALIVDRTLLENWIDSRYLSDESIFTELEMGILCFIGRRGDLIASMEQGPYPADYVQIEAFANAFGNFWKKNPDTELSDALYIEEYSLVLPVFKNHEVVDKSILFGRWITGGVKISIDSIDRVSQLMSWLPKEAVIKTAGIAGFNVQELPTREDEAATERKNGAFDKELFVLTGRPKLEQFFNENIIDIVMHQEQYAKMGVDFPGATILYGPPGSGKTYAITKLAEYLGWPRFDIDSSTIASPYIHDTAKKVAEVFQAAIDAAPSILVIDEMEAFLTDRGKDGQGGHHVEEVAEFLRQIPEAVSKGVLIFAMTNLIDSIDPAVLRRGRFDHMVEVGMASKEEIEELLKEKFKELPVSKSVSASKLALMLEGHPMSDIAYVIREAGRLAVKKHLEKINEECFDEAIAGIPQKKERSTIGFISE